MRRKRDQVTCSIVCHKMQATRITEPTILRSWSDFSSVSDDSNSHPVRTPCFDPCMTPVDGGTPAFPPVFWTDPWRLTPVLTPNFCADPCFLTSRGYTPAYESTGAGCTACKGVVRWQSGCSGVQQRARVPCGDVAVERLSGQERVGQSRHLGDIPDAVCATVCGVLTY